MSIFSYEDMILAMSQSATAAALEPLVANAEGQSEYNFTERCRALCMALCLNPNLSEDQMWRLAKRWPHHVQRNISFGLAMMSNPQEPPKPVAKEPGEKDDIRMAEDILQRPDEPCESLRAHVLAGLVRGMRSDYNEVVFRCSKKLEDMLTPGPLDGRNYLEDARVQDWLMDARKAVASNLLRCEPEVSFHKEAYERYLSHIDFCDEEFFERIARSPGKHDAPILLFLWQERHRFEKAPGFFGAMSQLVDRIALHADVSAFWASPWMAQVVRAYGNPHDSVKSMCAILATGILSPQQEQELLLLITEKRKSILLTQETPCPTND